MSAAPRNDGGRAATRVLFAAASLALCAGGIAMTAQGVAVPVRAEVAQMELSRTFDRTLAQNLRAKAMAEPAKAAAAPASARVRAPARAAARPAPIAPGQPLARITVERLGVRDVVLAGPATHDALAKAPMMVKQGDPASPVTVLAAHRDTHFLFIRDLREGDVVTLQFVTGESQAFRVTRFETVHWDKFAYPLDAPRPLLALATCYPFGGAEYGGPLRRVAWAEAIDPGEVDTVDTVLRKTVTPRNPV